MEQNNPLINTNIRLNYTKTILLVFISFLLVFFGGVSAASAATLYFSPSSGSYTVGQNFSVSVYVSSADQAMNAASGVISFPQDKLEVTSFSKSNSIFTLWVQEPAFSNDVGTVNLEGIVLNPGFTGATGKIITVNFKAKAAGNALLNFSSGSVLANDGKGTNILTSLGNAQFNLGYAGPSVPETTTPSITLGTPPAPQISSPTHPDPNKWYANNNAKFMWSVPSDAVATGLLYDKYPNSQPRVVYEPAISEKEISDLKDGVYYFHVQFKNNKGWGAISHFRFQIDTQPPEPFDIKFIDGEKSSNPQPTAVFDTTDSLSGIEYYKIKIGEGDFFVIAPEVVIKSNPYTLPLQMPGKRSILVQAYDKAGNYTVNSAEFVIKPILVPTITDYTNKITKGDPLIIRGKGVSNSTITIFLKSDENNILSQSVESDKDGFFNLIWQGKVENGVYALWAEATDERGAHSEKSTTHTLIVKKGPIEQFFATLLPYLAIIILILAIILLIIYLIMNFWRKYVELHKRIKKESQEPEAAISEYFGVLLKNIRSYLRLLEGAKTRKELLERKKEIINQIKNDLDSIEVLILKEIKDLEDRGN
ncbi:MAG: cohesin domain-containing protein [Candidatus Wolfebacteria bacterium]|nr:cohesin domain-containing protein [Candidatus Wolfebacteria bacterium]